MKFLSSCLKYEKKLILLTVLLPVAMSVILSSAMGGDRAGNGRKTLGGGTGEKNILYAYLMLPKYLELCYASPLCNATAFDQDLLEKVRQNLAMHPPSASQIRFLSERENPGAFYIDGKAHGNLRSAHTGEFPDSIIWVNSDHLYELSQGSYVPIDISSSAALLLDEVTHHVDARFSDEQLHLRLDLLCARLKFLLTTRTQKTSSDAGKLPVEATLMSFPQRTSFAQLYLSNNLETRDISPLLEKKIHCPNPKEKLTGLELSNLHWHASLPFMSTFGISAFPENLIADRKFYTLHAWMDLECNGKIVTPLKSQHLILTYVYADFPYEPSQLHYEWPEETIDIKQLDCAHADKGNSNCH